MNRLQFFFLSFLLFACSSEPSKQPEPEGWKSDEPQYAKCFSMWINGDETLLHVFTSTQRQDTLATYLFSNVGASPSVPTAGSISVPVEEMVTLSTTHIPFLSALQALEQVTGASYTNHLMDSTAIAMVRSGSMLEVSRGEGPDLETLIALDPQVVTCYPFGGDGNLPQRHGTASYVQITEYLETDPLGRAEWLKVFGLLVGKKQRADSLFDGIVSRYGSAKQLADQATSRPGVFFGSTWQGQWHAPGGDSYMAKLIKDAGGHYLFDDQPGQDNLTLSFEELYDKAGQAKYLGKVLSTSERVGAAQLLADDERLLALVSDNRIQPFYANSRTSDVFGMAVLQPDVVLQDLIKVFHPQAMEGHQAKYYQVTTEN